MIRLVFCLLTLTIFAACSSMEEALDIPPPLEETPAPPAEEAAVTQTTPVAPSAPVDAVWSYSGAFAPQFWGDLDPSFVMCKDGKHQSPIDLKWKKPTKNNPFSTSYAVGKVNVEDTGKLIRLTSDVANTIQMRTSVYSLQHADIHSPSEHSLSGKSFPMEIQFVHKNDKEFYSVVSVFVKAGKKNAVADKIIAAFPEGKNSSKQIAEPMLLSTLMPSKVTLYNYAGSLTQPPCSEGVNWIVLNTPVEFSKEQIAAFEARYTKNNRPKQPMNDRGTVNY